jgi:hypothetical protein
MLLSMLIFVAVLGCSEAKKPTRAGGDTTVSSDKEESDDLFFDPDQYLFPVTSAIQNSDTIGSVYVFSFANAPLPNDTPIQFSFEDEFSNLLAVESDGCVKVTDAPALIQAIAARGENGVILRGNLIAAKHNSSFAMAEIGLHVENDADDYENRIRDHLHSWSRLHRIHIDHASVIAERIIQTEYETIHSALETPGKLVTPADSAAFWGLRLPKETSSEVMSPADAGTNVRAKSSAQVPVRIAPVISRFAANVFELEKSPTAEVFRDRMMEMTIHIRNSSKKEILRIDDQQWQHWEVERAAIDHRTTLGSLERAIAYQKFWVSLQNRLPLINAKQQKVDEVRSELFGQQAL